MMEMEEKEEDQPEGVVEPAEVEELVEAEELAEVEEPVEEPVDVPRPLEENPDDQCRVWRPVRHLDSPDRNGV